MPNPQTSVTEIVSKERMEEMARQDMAVVPAVQKSRVMVLEVPRDMGDMLTNFRQNNPEDEIAVSRAMAPCDCNLDVHVGKTIRIIGVVMNMAEFESKESPGEMVNRVYASMVLDNGTIIGTTGKAVMGQLAYLVGSRPPGPFSPPAEYEVREHQMAKPKQPYYSLRRVLAKVGEKKKGVDNAK